jgi:hypothetical protein
MCQLPLQVLIMITGNYNWFNLHTALLLLPAWDSDADADGLPFPLLLGLPARALALWERLWARLLPRFLCYIVSLGAVGYATLSLFPVTYNPEAGGGLLAPLWALAQPDALHIENHITRSFLYDTVCSLLYLDSMRILMELVRF